MTFAALLLAGGESRRMGRDKATLELDGEPLWQRQLRILRGLNPDEIFVAARTAPPWLPDGVELLIDDPPSCGPLSGLARAMIEMRTTHLVVLAVDMPFMTWQELAALCDLAEEGCGVVPTIGDRAEPLAAIYPKEASNDFTAALQGSDFSLQRLILELAATAKVRLRPLGDDSVRFYRSVNSPSDFSCSDGAQSP